MRVFLTNEGQGWIWGTGDQPCIQHKTKGAGIMVSDFITQQEGYLALSSEECELATHAPRTSRVFLEYGCDKEGYWTEKSLLPMCGMRLQLPTSNIPANCISYCGYLIRTAAIVPREEALNARR